MILTILIFVISIKYFSADQSNDASDIKRTRRIFTPNKSDAINALVRSCEFDDRCTCKKFNRTTNTEVADCSRKELTSIPKIGTDIVIINLSHNNISTIQEYIFKDGERLQELDLSNNIISALLNGSFIGLENLLTLNLRSNHLVYKDGVFGLDSFYPMKNLRFLNIENNTIHQVNKSTGHAYPTFSSLIRLETLIVDGVEDKALGIKLQNITNLKTLRISHLTGKCFIERLTPAIFNNTCNLEKIQITGCSYLMAIEKGTFRHLSNLSHLDLSYNSFLGFNNIQNAFDDLPFTSIKHLKINKICPLFDRLFVSTSFLKPLQNTTLEVLEIDENNIDTVEKGALLVLPKTLKSISASYNSFTFRNHFYYDLEFLTITSLNISNMRGLTPSSNSNSGIGYFPLSTSMQNKTIGVPLEVLDFSNNLFSFNPVFILTYAVNIETLLFNNNHFGVVMEHDHEWIFLYGLSKLKTLSLSQNRIASIPSQFFSSSQVSLEYLDLSHNLLSNAEFKMDHMTKLTFLDLSKNQIKYLSLKVQQSLEAINNQKGNLTINLESNPMECSCDSIDFIKWLSDTKVYIKNLHKYECSKNDGTKLDLRYPKITYEILQKECSQFGYLIVIGSTFVIIFLIVVFGGVAYRYRWKLRYLYYMTKQRYKRLTVLQNNISDFRYNAFVSYSDQDQSFVHGEMLEQLETNFGLTLCLHKRDFLPGHEIAENITNAIHESYKTVVVFSENFLKSDWCMFEFNMARMETIYSRKGENVLFLIFYKTIPTSDIPLLMLELMQSETYIEYDVENELFWSKIREVLTI